MSNSNTQPIGKVSIVPRDAWSNSQQYYRLDLVTYQGGSYLAKSDNTNVTPTNTNTWLKIAEKGNKGDTGDPAATADVEAWLEDNVAPISSLITLPNWLDSETYSVNNVVLYTTNNKVYRCHTAVETAGTLPTNTSYWSEVVVASIIDNSLSITGAAADAKTTGDEINDLKSAINPSIYDIQIKKVKGQYVNADNGSFVNLATADRTDYIDCSKCKRISYYAGTSSLNNAFYDSSKVFISSFIMTSGKLYDNYRTVNVPTNAKYIVISNTDLDSVYLMPVSELAQTQKNNAFSGVVYTNGSNDIVLETSGTDIYVKFQSTAYVDHVRYDGQFVSSQIPGNQEFTIPNQSYLIFDADDGLAVKTWSEVRSIAPEKFISILLYNNKGEPRGMLNQTYSKDMPAYYTSYMASKVATINGIKADVGIASGFSFIFITDEHVKQNQMQSPKLIKNIRENTNIDVLINGGDIINKDDTKAEVYKNISNFVSTMTEKTGCDMYSVIGNHEFNNPNASQSASDLALMLSLTEVSSFLYTGANYADCVIDSDTMAYYKDFRGIRLFFLPCNYGSGVYRTAVWWIMEQMESLPAGCHFAVVSHVINEYQADMSQSTTYSHVQGLLDAMDALKNRQSFQYSTRTFDYTNSTAIPVCMIGGHAHTDYDFTTTGGIPVIMTTCDSYNQESGGLTRTPFTTSEQAFDVVTFDYTNQKIYLTRIGAGSDREFDY